MCLLEGWGGRGGGTGQALRLPPRPTLPGPLACGCCWGSGGVGCGRSSSAVPPPPSLAGRPWTRQSLERGVTSREQGISSGDRAQPPHVRCSSAWAARSRPSKSRSPPLSSRGAWCSVTWWEHRGFGVDKPGLTPRVPHAFLWPWFALHSLWAAGPGGRGGVGGGPARRRKGLVEKLLGPGDARSHGLRTPMAEVRPGLAVTSLGLGRAVVMVEVPPLPPAAPESRRF